MRITRAGWLGIVLISIGVILFSGVTDDYKTWLATILILSGLAVISQRPRSDRVQAELEERAFNSPPSGNYQSNTISRRVRTPRRVSISTLSMWAPVTALVLLFVLIVFWIFNAEEAKIGIWVHILPPISSVTTAAAQVRPVIVKVSLVNKVPVYSIGGQTFPIEQLSMRLRSQLSRLPEWVVYIDGAPTLELRDVGVVIDVANNLHAKVVLLTSKSSLRATELLSKAAR
jgi:biopolymer transport protein ExbD